MRSPSSGTSSGSSSPACRRMSRRRARSCRRSETWAEPGGGGAVAARAAREAQRRLRTSTPRSGTTSSGASRREAGRARRDVPCREDEQADAGAGSSTSMRSASGRSPCSARSSAPARVKPEELVGHDAVLFISGDAEALLAARRARTLVAVSARAAHAARRARSSSTRSSAAASDDGERYHPGDLDPPPKLVVTTSGSLGGWTQPGGPYRAAPLPGPVSDAYGCGDSFTAALTFALARGDEPAEARGARGAVRRRGDDGPRPVRASAHGRRGRDGSPSSRSVPHPEAVLALR